MRMGVAPTLMPLTIVCINPILFVLYLHLPVLYTHLALRADPRTHHQVDHRPPCRPACHSAREVMAHPSRVYAPCRRWWQCRGGECTHNIIPSLPWVGLWRSSLHQTHTQQAAPPRHMCLCLLLPSSCVGSNEGPHARLQSGGCVGCGRKPSHSFGEWRVTVGCVGCGQKPSRSFGQRRVMLEGVGVSTRPSHSFGERRIVVGRRAESGGSA